MEKKKNLKNRVFAGLLALTLAGCKPALVKAEKSDVEYVTPTVIEYTGHENDYEYFEEEFMMYGCKETGLHAHVYEDENGNKKVFASEASFIDDYEWSNETVPVKYSSDEVCDIKEDHAHLYLSKKGSLLIPIYSEEKTIDDTYYKTQFVCFLSKEKCEELKQLGLFRVVDNIIPLENANFDAKDSYVSLRTIEVENGRGIFTYEFDEVGERINSSHYVNLLYPYAVTVTEEEKAICDKDNTVELKMSADYQKKLVKPTFVR